MCVKVMICIGIKHNGDKRGCFYLILHNSYHIIINMIEPQSRESKLIDVQVGNVIVISMRVKIAIGIEMK